MYRIGITYQDVDEVLKHEHVDDVDCNIVFCTPYRTRQAAVKALMKELHITQCLTTCGTLEVLEGLYNKDGSLAWGNGVLEHIPSKREERELERLRHEKPTKKIFRSSADPMGLGSPNGD